MNTKELERKLHINSVELARFCKNHERVFIYGAGEYARRVAHFLDVENIETEGFVVSDEELSDTDYCGKKVYKIGDVIKLTGKNGFVRGVSDKYVDEIRNKLNSLKVSWEDIYLQDVFHDRPFVIGGMIPDVGRINACFDSSLPDSYFGGFISLDKLGEKYNTDKRSGLHNYLNKYDFFLDKYRNENVTIMELGVFNGSSVQMWEEYFANGKIIGVDIDERCKQYEKGRTKIIIEDLSDPENISVLRDYEANIIIDDASHKWSHQILALSILFDSLNPGGVYILEDLETSFPASRDLVYSDASVSAFQFLSAISEVITGREYLTSDCKSAALYSLREEIEHIANQTEMISFISGSCILIKK